MQVNICRCFLIPVFLLFFHVFNSIATSVCDWNVYISAFNLYHVGVCNVKVTVSRKLIKHLSDWNFSEPPLMRLFPIDPEKRNYVREVANVLFSEVKPTAFKTDVKLVACSEDAIKDILDLHPAICQNDNFISIVSGNSLHKNMTPLSHRYGGHQFGVWVDQLGDGRAVMLGEYVNQQGERWELQLKGSGRTPYSRRGDGRAVLRSSVREFLCSEAMHYLGIPTSRAATLIVSNDPVMRDQFYDGHPKQERGAVVLRLSKSWFRIGTLELLAMKGETKLLKQVVDFTIEQYFQHIDSTDPNKYLAFYDEVVAQTAEMIVKWQSVGFTHGVCNTDNFSLLSITIDYGPFGFLDEYNPKFVPNTSDDEAMYSYERQPDVGYFNLNKLRIALLPLLDQNKQKVLLQVLQGYAEIYKHRFMEVFREKLGLNGKNEQDEYFVALLLKMMEDQRADFTLTFRHLGDLTVKHLKKKYIPESLWALKQLEPHEYFESWLKMYLDRIEMSDQTDETRRFKMHSVNPRYILRNWMAQSAIEKAENDDFSEVRKILNILKKPHIEQEEAENAGYAKTPPRWAKALRVSCSS